VKGHQTLGGRVGDAVQELLGLPAPDGHGSPQLVGDVGHQCAPRRLLFGQSAGHVTEGTAQLTELAGRCAQQPFGVRFTGGKGPGSRGQGDQRPGDPPGNHRGGHHSEQHCEGCADGEGAQQRIAGGLDGGPRASGKGEVRGAHCGAVNDDRHDNRLAIVGLDGGTGGRHEHSSDGANPDPGVGGAHASVVMRARSPRLGRVVPVVAGWARGGPVGHRWVRRRQCRRVLPGVVVVRSHRGDLVAGVVPDDDPGALGQGEGLQGREVLRTPGTLPGGVRGGQRRGDLLLQLCLLLGDQRRGSPVHRHRSRDCDQGDRADRDCDKGGQQPSADRTEACPHWTHDRLQVACQHQPTRCTRPAPGPSVPCGTGSGVGRAGPFSGSHRRCGGRRLRCHRGCGHRASWRGGRCPGPRRWHGG